MAERRAGHSQLTVLYSQTVNRMGVFVDIDLNTAPVGHPNIRLTEPGEVDIPNIVSRVAFVCVFLLPCYVGHGAEGVVSLGDGNPGDLVHGDHGCVLLGQ